MTIVLGAVCVALVVALVVIVRALTGAYRASEGHWAEERRELLNRIQAPERLPVSAPATWASPDDEPDDFALVGTIQIDEEYGTDDFYNAPELP